MSLVREGGEKRMVEGQEMRKGPWTEQEDIQLMCFVGLFGDRRWDFIAKVSGLKVAGDTGYRTGKSCRLRWVNYLHPGLKRGKMTAQEERLVLELHSKWGSRWSKIASKLPGRTDNEIKNYWRTHMRKKAQEKRRALSSSSSSSISSSSSNNSAMEFPADTGPVKFFDSGGSEISASSSSSSTNKNNKMEENQELGDPNGYSMDDIWKDIDLIDDHGSLIINQDHVVYSEEGCNFSCPALNSPSSWDYYCEEESRLIFSGYDDHNGRPRLNQATNLNFFY